MFFINKDDTIHLLHMLQTDPTDSIQHCHCVSVYILQSTIFRHCAWQIHTCCVHLLCTINFLCLILRNLQIVQCVTQCCRSGSEFFHPGSRVKKILGFWSGFSPKRLFLSSRKYDPDLLSRIRTLIFYPSRIQGPKCHRIPDPQLCRWFRFAQLAKGKKSRP